MFIAQISTWFFFADFGLGVAVYNKVSKYGLGDAKTKELISALLIFHTFIAFVSGLTMFFFDQLNLWSKFLPQVSTSSELNRSISLSVFITFLTIPLNLVFRILHANSRLTFSNIVLGIIPLLNLALLLCLLVTESNFIWIVLSPSVSFLLVCFFTFRHLNLHRILTYVSPCQVLERIRSEIRLGMYWMLFVLLLVFTSQIPRLFLLKENMDSDAASYSLYLSFLLSAVSLVSGIGGLIGPRFRAENDVSKSKFSLPLILSALFVLSIFFLIFLNLIDVILRNFDQIFLSFRETVFCSLIFYGFAAMNLLFNIFTERRDLEIFVKRGFLSFVVICGGIALYDFDLVSFHIYEVLAVYVLTASSLMTIDVYRFHGKDVWHW
jgi:O-antigen/teichoic acid export membrane protein